MAIVACLVSSVPSVEPSCVGCSSLYHHPSARAFCFNPKVYQARDLSLRYIHELFYSVKKTNSGSNFPKEDDILNYV